MSIPEAVQWMTLAACKNDPPELYDEEFKETPPPAVKCNFCPVTAHCLTYALNHGYEGTWGGTTISNRRKIKRRQTRVACPGEDCKSQNIDRSRGKHTCLSCGLSWPAPRSE